MFGHVWTRLETFCLVLDTDFGHGLLLDMFGHVWTRFRIRQNDDQQPQNILDIFGHVWTRAVVCLIVVLIEFDNFGLAGVLGQRRDVMFQPGR